jgi:acyl carrier protein
VKRERDSKMTHENTILNFIQENFLLGEGIETLQLSDSFLQKGILDSTGVLELISFLEEQFDVQITDEEILPDNLDSIEKIDRFIQKKQTTMMV